MAIKQITDQERFENLRAIWSEIEQASPGSGSHIAAKVANLPRVHNHLTWCDCVKCQQLRRKDGKVQYGIKVPKSLKVVLTDLGPEKVLEHLFLLKKES